MNKNSEVEKEAVINIPNMKNMEEMCWDFVNKKCYRNSCCYSHHIPACVDFIHGTCNRMKCRFLH